MIKYTSNNPRYPHIVKIVRVLESDTPFEDVSVSEKVLYEGVGRSYTMSSETFGGNVDKTKRRVSIPVRFDEWSEPLLDGDTIAVKIGNIVEKGRVLDAEPDNNRTLLYWEFVKA